MQKITAAQFFVLLFLCRVFTFFTLTPGSGRAMDGTAPMLGLAAGWAGALALSAPALLILRRHEGQGIVEYAFSKNRAAGVASATLYGLLALLETVNAVSRFTLFITDAVYPDEQSWIFAVLFTLTALYLVWMGLEAAARLSGLVLVALAASVALIVVSLAPQFHPDGIATPLLGGIAPVAREAAASLGETAELLLVLLYVPYLRGAGRIGRPFLLWMAATLACLEGLLFLSLTTVGDYAATQTYPLYAVAKMARLFDFQRLDALHMVVWTMVGLIKAAAFLYAARQCFMSVCAAKRQKWILPACGAAAGTAALLLTLDFRAYEAFYTISMSGAALVLGVLLVPLLLALIPRKKSAAKREEESA